MGNSESIGNNTGREHNNRNESNPNWTEIVAGVADLYNQFSSTNTGTLPNSDSRSAVPSSSSSASGGGSDSNPGGWQFPEMGWIKCNVDGSFLPERSSAGCGGVFRDSQGNWLYGFSRKLVYSDLTTAEIDAIYTGLKVGWERRRDFNKLIIESDSKAAVDLVTEGVGYSHPLAMAVNRAREYLNKDWIERPKIVYISRNYNKVADKLAALSHYLLGEGMKVYDNPPDCCIEFHLADVSKARSLRMSNDSNPWKGIAAGVAGVAGAAVIAGGLYSYLSSSTWVTCNVDGSFLPEKRSAGCGGVFFDTEGKWLHGFAEKIVYYDNNQAEAYAMFRGLEEACRLGYKKVIIESDSEPVVNHVNKLIPATADRRLAELVDQVIDYKSKDDLKVEIVHVYGKKNKVADKLAELSHELQDGELKTYEDPPQACIQFLRNGPSGKYRRP